MLYIEFTEDNHQETIGPFEWVETINSDLFGKRADQSEADHLSHMVDHRWKRSGRLFSHMVITALHLTPSKRE